MAQCIRHLHSMFKGFDSAIVVIPRVGEIANTTGGGSFVVTFPIAGRACLVFENIVQVTVITLPRVYMIMEFATCVFRIMALLQV